MINYAVKFNLLQNLKKKKKRDFQYLELWFIDRFIFNQQDAVSAKHQHYGYMNKQQSLCSYCYCKKFDKGNSINYVNEKDF